MARRTRPQDFDEADVEVGRPSRAAAGVTGVTVALRRSVQQMGVRRSTRSLRKLNQADGFDCQGCAWPDPAPGDRHHAEFCENGAKAVADEATRDLLDRSFMAAHPVADLAEHTDYWLNQQGRITEPFVLREGGTHYEPVSWPDAFALMARHLRAIDPDQAIFYTSGKVSNEAAYLYQLFARAYGTNNLPDCSNMCHESTSVGLQEVIGIGKGSVSLDDVHEAELIVIMGQNPGTNHPRMLTALETAKRNGARIIAVNPLKEAGLIRFKNPQTPRGVVGPGTGLADLYLQIRGGGDLALLQAIGSLLLQRGSVDHDFVAQHTTGFEQYAAALATLDWDVVLASTGLTRAEIEQAAEMFAASAQDGHLLGDGHHPAPQRRRHRQGDRQPRAPPGQHRQARSRAVPGARPLQRPGRPHHGHLGAGARPLPRQPARRVRLRAAPGARPRQRRRDQGAARRRRPGVRGPRRQLRLRRPRHVGDRGGDAVGRPDRARLHQAQPLARRARPRGPHPPGARAQRAGPDRRSAASGSRSRTPCRRCTPRTAR